MRIVSAVFGLVLVVGGMACSSSDHDKAREQAREDVREAADEAKKAGQEIKKDAKELSRGVNAAMQPDSESASEKIAHAEAKARIAASHAGVKLDHAALLAEVKAKMASDAGLSTLTDVNIAVDGTVVTLSGTVANENQKKAAETAASQVDGVTQVQNRLTVQP